MRNPELAAHAHLMANWAGDTPVDVLRLAEAAGLEAYSSAGLAEGVLAVARLSADAPYRITVRADQAPRITRLAIAHVVGRILLQQEGVEEEQLLTVSEFSAVDLSSAGQANKVALALLMPRRALEYAIHHVTTDVEVLCRLFDVSPAALAARLKMLGIAT